MFVCRCVMTASLAFESRLGDAVFGGCIPTFLAAVRGVPGVDLNPDTASIFRFGAQNRDELAPASVTDTPIEPGLRPGTVGQIPPRVVRIGNRFGPSQHIGDRQILHYEKVVGLDESAGSLVVKVPALVGDLAMP